jgi:DNA primase catalytic subunit
VWINRREGKMNSSNGERFFELVRWFNNFSEQLYNLFTKISNVLKKELNFEEVRRYAQFYTVMPKISDIYHMGFVKNSDYSLNVMMVLEKNRLTHDVYKKIPSLIIASIENSNGHFDENYWELFSDENMSIEKSKDIITGKLKNGDNGRTFKAFQVDLELFNTRKAEKVIDENIIPKLKKII